MVVDSKLGRETGRESGISVMRESHRGHDAIAQAGVSERPLTDTDDTSETSDGETESEQRP